MTHTLLEGDRPEVADLDRVGLELRRLLDEARSAADRSAAERELLRRRTTFFLTQLAMLDRERAYPEAAELRRWLTGATAEPACPSGRGSSSSAVIGSAPPAQPLEARQSAPGGSRGDSRLGAETARSAVAAPAPTRGRGPVFSALAALLLAALIVAPLGAVLLSYRTYVVLTGSMAPTMPVGTLLIVEPVAAARVSVGDVITFPHPDRPSDTVTHRVLRVDDGPLGRFLQTKGDANPVPDAWRVPATGEVWRVVLAVPYLGRLYQAAADPSARLGLLVLPSLFLGALSLGNLWRGERRVTASV